MKPTLVISVNSNCILSWRYESFNVFIIGKIFFLHVHFHGGEAKFTTVKKLYLYHKRSKLKLSPGTWRRCELWIHVKIK